MKKLVLVLVLAACTPPVGTAPVVPDASDASPCAVADALTQGRMIRDPDGGMALVVPCP
jgi:hypothetical protein